MLTSLIGRVLTAAQMDAVRMKLGLGASAPVLARHHQREGRAPVHVDEFWEFPVEVNRRTAACSPSARRVTPALLAMVASAAWALPSPQKTGRRYSCVRSSLRSPRRNDPDSRRGMEFALNFLRSNAQLDRSALLSSPFLLVALGYYGHVRRYEISPTEARDLRHWLLVANAKGRYSRGSSETILDQDLSTLSRQGGTAELVDRLRLQVGRLDIAQEELDGRSQRSALFKTMFLAFRAADARDWRSSLAIALGHRGSQHKLQFHHIFPKTLLKSRYTSREADDIANLAFISGKTNRQISDKSPSQYFPELIKNSGLAAFRAQCIPTDAGLLEIDAYKAFLDERRRLVSRRLNEFLAVPQT